MDDLMVALGPLRNLIDSFGRVIVARFSLLNVWTALLLAGALVVL
jgi:hypothetical protein